jgi:hypothetical protein
MRLEHIKCLTYILREIIMQQKPSNSNVNNQFVTITDADRQAIIKQVNSDFTIKATSWKKDSNNRWVADATGIFGTCKTPDKHIDVRNMSNFRDHFISDIVKAHLTQKQGSKILAELFNAPIIHLKQNYNILDVQYIILSEMNKIIMQTAAFYRLNLNTVKENGWDFESFEAVKEFKKANPIQATPQTKGPMDRFVTPGSSLPSSSNSKPTPTPSRKLGALDKFFTRTPKAVLATSNDSDDNLSSYHSGSSVASTSGHKQAVAPTAAAAAVAVPAVSNNDSSVASTSLKDPRNQPAAAAALVVVNPGQNANSVNIAIASSASSTLAIHQFSTPKKATTISLNVSADGRRITQRTTPLSPTRPNNTSTKRTSQVAGFREEDDDAIVGSPYKAPRTKENQLSR